MIETSFLTSTPTANFAGKDQLSFQDDNRIGVRWNSSTKHYEKWFAKYFPLPTNMELEQIFVQYGNIAEQMQLQNPSIKLVPHNTHGSNITVGFISGWEVTDKSYIDAFTEAKNILHIKNSQQHGASHNNGRMFFQNAFNLFHPAH